jgi:uncharacterized protein (TIGR02217 family)
MPAPIFPTLPGLTFPVTRSNLGFEVDTAESLSGIRTTFPNRAVPRYQWSIGFEMLRTGQIGADAFAELEILAGFYNGRFGRAYPFAYQDAADNAATAAIFATGDGTTYRFQLVRDLGGFVEPVRVPLAVSLFVDGIAINPASYSIGSYGRVTFSSPPAAGATLSWTGTFAWLCRFDDDKVDFTNFMRGYWSLDKLTFSSEILP